MFNLRADTRFNSYATGCYISDTGIEDKDVMDPVTHCTKPSSHSGISQKILVSFSRGTSIIYLPSLRDG